MADLGVTNLGKFSSTALSGLTEEPTGSLTAGSHPNFKKIRGLLREPHESTSTHLSTC